MIATGAVAFANARVRAMKSRLLGHEVAGRAMAGLAAAPDDRWDRARGFAELIDWYAIVLKSYPRGHALFLSLLRRLEIENVKLLWRAVVNGIVDSRWHRHWLDLGRLASIELESCRDCRTLPAIVDALRKTPYASIASDMWRAHAADPAAAELGFDRWTSQRIRDAAASLPVDDATAIELALAVVRERDINIARRLIAAGLPAPAVKWPREWQRHAPASSDYDQLVLWIRRQRRRLCRQAFLQTPFCVAPAVALLLLKEEELRGLDAIALFDPAQADTASLTCALAAGELGA